MRALLVDSEEVDYIGYFKGLRFYSTPEQIGLQLPDGRWRTVRWMERFGGRVRTGLVYLWGTNRPVLAKQTQQLFTDQP